jgi:PAS domain S-box-containing protein
MDTHDDQFFRRLCDNLAFILIAVDPELRVQFWNQQASRQFGRDARSVKGQPFLDLFGQPDRDQAQRLLEAAIEEGSADDMEIRWVDPDRGRLTFIMIVSPITDASGRRVGASIGMRDISERKRLARELSKSRRLAALGNMAGGVAHHFNNILGGMLTSIDSVLSSDSPRELRRTLRLLAQAIGRATRITRQLETFAASEHDGRVESAQLAQIVRMFVEQIRPQCERAQVQLNSHIEEFPSREFEAQRLMAVLESLAQNGLDAMCPGGTLTIRMTREGEFALITMADSGCGMADDVLDRVFEPFFTTKGELAGGASNNIGLGLAVVHGLVAEMGGTIEIASRVGEGTAVTIRLPLRVPATAEPPQPVGVETANANSSAS